MRPQTDFTVLGEADPLPDPANCSPEGLAAIGGGLSVERLVEAYSKGLFPWSADPVTWWSPDPRAVIPLDGLRVSRRLLQRIRQGSYRIEVNTAFRRVMLACARPRRPGETTWIAPCLVDAYERLHRAGYAHSIEVWRDRRLAGGVYGVAVGAMFAGESMFHAEPDASKIALYHLVERLCERGFVLFDAQAANPFTLRMGAVEIPRSEFLERLRNAAARTASFVSAS